MEPQVVNIPHFDSDPDSIGCGVGESGGNNYGAMPGSSPESATESDRHSMLVRSIEVVGAVLERESILPRQPGSVGDDLVKESRRIQLSLLKKLAELHGV